ncbi:YaaW family protein [Ferrovum myxofaciens]|uniref:YaaW family protein n=1 Tax=Ferrovum myxofaciens TaxID=416213 RepID=UPI0004E153EC|nr:ubiquinol-cytochrome C chaperone family protein [Ferrovum myxofaciens]
MRKDKEDLALLNILQQCEAKEKIPLIDYITDSGNGRLSLSEKSKNQLVSAKTSEKFDDARNQLIIEEIQAFGGNSLVNLIRFGEGVSYDEIVRDVTSKVGVKVKSTDSCEDMENAIISKIIEKAWDKMSPEERNTMTEFMHIPAKGSATLAAVLAAAELGGFATFQLAASVANALARQIIGRGLTFGANAALMEGLSVLVGPVGWAVMALWLAADLAGPAYRVTVPCVIQIAYLRQTIAIKNFKICPQGHLQKDPNAKFCSTCGAPIGAPRLRNA